MERAFENIVTFKPSVETRLVPFEYNSNLEELRVWALGDDGCEISLSLGDDFSVDDQDNITVADAYKDLAITVAAVPCPELKLPKIGNIPNQDLQTVFNELVEYTRFLESRIGSMLSRPAGLKDGVCYVPTYEDGKISWISQGAFLSKRETHDPETIIPKSFSFTPCNVALSSGYDLDFSAKDQQICIDRAKKLSRWTMKNYCAETVTPAGCDIPVIATCLPKGSEHAPFQFSAKIGTAIQMERK